MGGGRDNGGGLSLQTLVIASLSSLAAALFIHEFWQGGAILGAAVTPVIVALVSEGLRKPVDVISSRTGRTAVEPPPVVTGSRGDDPFGIWEEQKQPRRRGRLHVKLAVATGVIAFLIAGFFLTGAELVLGGADDGDRFRVLPGKQRKADTRDTPARTTPEEATPAPGATEGEPAPDEDAPPAATAPPETAPEDVPEQEPPAETTPAPGPGATTPVP